MSRERIVRFLLWMNNFGNKGKLEFYSSNDTFLKIEFLGREIKIFPYMVR